MKNIIDEIVAKLDKSFNQCDLDTVMEFYTEKAAVVIEPGKVITGKKAIRQAFAQAMPLKGQANQLVTSVIETENSALFLSKWTFEWTIDGKTHSRESIATTVFIKDTAGEWKIEIDNSFGPAVLDT